MALPQWAVPAHSSMLHLSGSHLHAVQGYQDTDVQGSKCFLHSKDVDAKKQSVRFDLSVLVLVI